MKKVILASASPRRRELLEQIGMDFQICYSQAEEIISEKEPISVVQSLSSLKAKDVAGRMDSEEALIIGADTIVAIQGEILGKPRDEKTAAAMLWKLQGKMHQVYTGVTLIHMTENNVQSHTFSEKTKVAFYPMTMEEISCYVSTKEPMDKAGAYGIQGRGAVYIKEIQGDYNNVVGLPLARMYQEIKAWDISLYSELFSCKNIGEPIK